MALQPRPKTHQRLYEHVIMTSSSVLHIWVLSEPICSDPYLRFRQTIALMSWPPSQHPPPGATFWWHRTAQIIKRSHKQESRKPFDWRFREWWSWDRVVLYREHRRKTNQLNQHPRWSHLRSLDLPVFICVQVESGSEALMSKWM